MDVMKETKTDKVLLENSIIIPKSLEVMAAFSGLLKTMLFQSSVQKEFWKMIWATHYTNQTQTVVASFLRCLLKCLILRNSGAQI